MKTILQTIIAVLIIFSAGGQLLAAESSGETFDFRFVIFDHDTNERLSGVEIMWSDGMSQTTDVDGFTPTKVIEKSEVVSLTITMPNDFKINFLSPYEVNTRDWQYNADRSEVATTVDHVFGDSQVFGLSLTSTPTLTIDDSVCRYDAGISLRLPAGSGMFIDENTPPCFGGRYSYNGQVFETWSELISQLPTQRPWDEILIKHEAGAPPPDSFVLTQNWGVELVTTTLTGEGVVVKENVNTVDGFQSGVITATHVNTTPVVQYENYYLETHPSGEFLLSFLLDREKCLKNPDILFEKNGSHFSASFKNTFSNPIEIFDGSNAIVINPGETKAVNNKTTMFIIEVRPSGRATCGLVITSLEATPTSVGLTSNEARAKGSAIVALLFICFGLIFMWFIVRLRR